MGLCEGFVLIWSIRAGKHCKEIMAAYWHLGEQRVLSYGYFRDFHQIFVAFDYEDLGREIIR